MIKYIRMINILGITNKLPSVDFEGLEDEPITNILMKNITIITSSNESSQVYRCSEVYGEAYDVFPLPCP